MRRQMDDARSISQRLESFSRERMSEAAEWGEDAERFTKHTVGFIGGGKLLRGRFCCAGWRAVARGGDDAPEFVVTASAALEVFQVAALVHDDIIDNSDTRRGMPSAHRSFAQAHRDAQWVGDADIYGRSSAILAGDLLLAWSDDLFERALADAEAVAAATRAQYARMRREVMVGQYLDVAEEMVWPHIPSAEHVGRALRIAELKSARYSVQQPMLIGAHLAGAYETDLASLGAFGDALGLAFQLRDDILGVFGDSDETGKPSGDDLREGKRTLLIAYARERLSGAELAAFDEAVGNAALGDHDVARVQRTIEQTGARQRVEDDIDRYAADARAVLRDSAFDPDTVGALGDLVDASARRVA